MTTRVEVLEPAGATRVWLPAALVTATPYQRTIFNSFEAPRGTATLIQSTPDSLGIVWAEFASV